MAQEVNSPSSASRGSGRKWIWLVIALIVAAAGAGAFRAWQLQARLARIHSALPAQPNLAGKPDVLIQLHAKAMAQTRLSQDPRGGVLELARLYHANGFFREAEACWRILATTEPQEPKWGYYLSNLRRQASDYDGMVALLEQTVKLAPDYAPAWLQLAELSLKTGRLEIAAGYYQKRLALLPKDPYARLGMVRIALQTGRRDDAKRLLEELLRDDPKFSTAHNLYAEILAAQGDNAGASRHRLLGRETGRFREAGDPWLEELQAWCYDYGQLCNLGTIEYQTVHGDRGVSLFERAIKIRPNDPTAYEQLGVVYLQINEPAKARAILEEGLAKSKDGKLSMLGYVNLSRAYRFIKQPADAVRVARQGLEVVGDEFELYDALGTALGDLGDRDGSVEALRTAVRLNPNDANANYNLALALVAVRKLDDAVAALHRSLALQPTFPSSLAMLAQIEIDSGRWQNAAQYLRPLYDSHPEMPQARQMMALWYLRSGVEAEEKKDLATAEQHYRNGASVEPSHPELQARLGTLCLIQGRFADAVPPLEAYHRLQSENPQAALYLGQAYAASGRIDDAKKVLTEGAQLAERSGNATTAQYCREILRQLP